MPTVRDPIPVDAQRLRQIGERTKSQELMRLADHEHPQHGGWLADGDERRDWTSTILMDCFRQSRDQEAMEVLYELHAEVFLRTIRHRLRTSRIDADADDLLQETFFAICRYPDGFRADRPHAFRCWAFRILYNTITTAARVRRRHPVQIEAHDFGALEPVSDAPTPDRAASDHEVLIAASRAWPLLLQSYLHAYLQLSRSDRALLEAVEVERRPYAELAEQLGVRISALKVRVFRARQRIAAHLQAVLRPAKTAA